MTVSTDVAARLLEAGTDQVKLNAVKVQYPALPPGILLLEQTQRN